MKNDGSIKEHCNKCLGWKNHTVVYTETKAWDEDLDDDGSVTISGSDTWTLVRCLGCDAVRLKHQHWFSEDTDEHGRPEIHTEFFPPSINRQKPKWRRQFLPFNVHLNDCNSLCDEIYGTLALGANRLATMGIRALVEKLMIDQVGDHRNFEKNISAFFEAGHVSPNQQQMFRDTLVEAGHAAMHRNFEPSDDTVNTLLDIVEGVMHAVYYAPMLAEQVKKTIPARS